MPLSPLFRRTAAAHGAAALAVAALALGASSAQAGLLGTAPAPTTPQATTPEPTTPPATTPVATTPTETTNLPDIVHASDAPPGTLTPNPTPGTNLVANAERVTLPKTTTVVALGPSLSFRSAGKDLDVARRRGLRVKLTVAGATSLKVYATISKAAAERTTDGTSLADQSGPTVTLARASISRPASGTVISTLRFGPSAQDTLMQFARVRITIRLVATDAKGQRTVVDRPLDLH